MRIVVLGAGTIGCFVGGCWQLAGADVRFIGRPSLAGAVAAHGLGLSDSGGWSALIAPGDVRFGCTPDPLRDADLIALCVKSAATGQAAQEIAAHGRPGAAVLSLQNGVSNVATLEQQLQGRFEVLRGMVSYNVAHLGDGRFHKGVSGAVWAQDHPLLRRLAGQVGGTPAPLRLSEDMMGVAWGKLIINLNNAINALSGRTLLGQLRNRTYRRVAAASMAEALDLIRRAGIRPARTGPVPPSLLPRVMAAPDWLFGTIFLRMQKIDERARSSMADDVASGRRTEVDYLNGEVVRLAQQLAMDAPINRKIVALVRRAEEGAPPLSPAALWSAVFR